MKEWIVFFGEDWGGLNSTGQYIARNLQSDYNIMWVNSIGLREPDFSLHDFKRIFEKLYDFCLPSGSLESDSSNSIGSIFPVTFIAIPYLRFSSIRKINVIILSFLLKRKFRELHIDDPIIITACPSAADIIEYISSKRKIYYCADDHSELPGLNKQTVKELESKLFASVDYIVATSRALEKKIKKYNPNTVYIPHGVNFDIFLQAKISDETIPEDMKLCGKPIIGYFGLIGEHLDYELIARVSEVFSNASIVMVGPIEATMIGKIPTNKNIYYLGQKLYSQAPYYMKSFSICQLPWKNTARNKYANPTKIREYLAADKQVVATTHPELVDLSEYVYTADNIDEYISNIRTALSRIDEISSNSVSDTVKNQTWQSRALEFKKLLL